MLRSASFQYLERRCRFSRLSIRNEREKSVKRAAKGAPQNASPSGHQCERFRDASLYIHSVFSTQPKLMDFQTVAGMKSDYFERNVSIVSGKVRSGIGVYHVSTTSIVFNKILLSTQNTSKERRLLQIK